MSYPLGGAARDIEPGSAQFFQKDGTKDPGEIEVIEEVLLLDLAPFSSRSMDPSSGHDKVHVGVVVDSPGMGMQHGGSGKLRLQTGVIEAESSQGLDRRIEQQGIEGLLLGSGQRVQLSGQGEGDHEIGYRQQLQALSFTPQGIAVLVALGAGPVSTREGPVLLPVTLGTVQREQAVLSGPAAKHSVEGRPLFRSGNGAIACRISREIVAQKGLQVHVSPPIE